MYDLDSGVDGGPGGPGSDLHQEIHFGIGLSQGGGVGVRRQLPHSAAAAGSADPEDPADGERRGGPVYLSGEAAGSG